MGLAIPSISCSSCLVSLISLINSPDDVLVHRLKCDDVDRPLSQDGERISQHIAYSTWAILCITLFARRSLDINCVQLAKAWGGAYYTINLGRIICGLNMCCRLFKNMAGKEIECGSLPSNSPLSMRRSFEFINQKNLWLWLWENSRLALLLWEQDLLDPQRPSV